MLFFPLNIILCLIILIDSCIQMAIEYFATNTFYWIRISTIFPYFIIFKAFVYPARPAAANIIATNRMSYWTDTKYGRLNSYFLLEGSLLRNYKHDAELIWSSWIKYRQSKCPFFLKEIFERKQPKASFSCGETILKASFYYHKIRNISLCWMFFFVS